MHRIPRHSQAAADHLQTCLTLVNLLQHHMPSGCMHAGMGNRWAGGNRVERYQVRDNRVDNKVERYRGYKNFMEGKYITLANFLTVTLCLRLFHNMLLTF